METLGFLAYPFLACVVLILIHAYFGIHILERGIIFLDLSLAQFIAVGIAIAYATGNESSARLYYAGAFAVLGAFVLSFSKQIARYVNIEAFIGVLYVFSFAASILFLDRSPHGMEEFRSILNGNVLWVTSDELLKASLLYGAIGGFHTLFWMKFKGLTYGEGNSLFWEFIFFLTFAMVLVSSVQLAGILQVFSFLVIPALIGRLFTREPLRILLIGWAIGFVVSMVGVALSYQMDVPTAPLIVACLSFGFFFSLAIKMLRAPKGKQGRG
jgi:zinc/manganese transport system permease protein